VSPEQTTAAQTTAAQTPGPAAQVLLGWMREGEQ